MRFIGLAIIAICIFSCKKENLNQPNTPDIAEEGKYFVLGSDSGAINFKIIPNPELKVDSFHQGTVVKESYWLEVPGHAVIRISRWEGYAPGSDSSFSRYDNLIRIEGAKHVLAEAVVEELTISESLMEDSIYYLSHYSPFPDLVQIRERHSDTSFYPIAYNEGDTVIVSQDNPHWRSGFLMNLPPLLQGFTFYYHQLHEERQTYPDSTERFILRDVYYPAWAGLNQKYLVFNYAHNYNPWIKPENIKMGWIKVSVGEDGSLKVHEFAHQIE